MAFTTKNLAIARCSWFAAVYVMGFPAELAPLVAPHVRLELSVAPATIMIVTDACALTPPSRTLPCQGHSFR